jgi:hypothetical protein
MSENSPREGLNRWPLAEVSAACCEETRKFRAGQPSSDHFCYELLRRAVCERDGASWEAVLTQYRGLVLAWIRLHPAAVAPAVAAEGDDYWINQAFSRFWAHVGPDRFGRFATLADLLKYLKSCVHSALVDELRRHGRTPTVPFDPESEATATRSDDVGERAAAAELWAAIERECTGGHELVVVRESLVHGRKPSEIYASHPDLFVDVVEVYRIKRSMLDRLRRNPHIRAFWE